MTELFSKASAATERSYISGFFLPFGYREKTSIKEVVLLLSRMSIILIALWLYMGSNRILEISEAAHCMHFGDSLYAQVTPGN